MWQWWRRASLNIRSYNVPYSTKVQNIKQEWKVLVKKNLHPLSDKYTRQYLVMTGYACEHWACSRSKSSLMLFVYWNVFLVWNHLLSTENRIWTLYWARITQQSTSHWYINLPSSIAKPILHSTEEDRSQSATITEWGPPK